MASFAPVRGTRTQINATSIIDGQFLLETDQGDNSRILLDVGSNRITVSNGIAPVWIKVTGQAITAGGKIRIPASGTNSSIKTTSQIIPMSDNGTGIPISYTKIDVTTGYVEITVAEDVVASNSIGILVYNK